ncbi:MAG: hypothetical protein P8J44_05725 [Gammaproteobacteria bacterium]|nr:hypothetical protein [Gammaproteobacteria bacterium]
MVEDTSTDEVIVEQADGQAGNAKAATTPDDFVRQLAALYKELKFAKNLKKAMKEVEGTMLELMGSKMFTIYQSVDNGKEIVASFKGDTRPSEGDDDIEIRVPFTPTSLAGYVALSQHPLLVEDVYDAEKLTDIHARLQWDKSFSES